MCLSKYIHLSTCFFHWQTQIVILRPSSACQPKTIFGIFRLYPDWFLRSRKSPWNVTFANCMYPSHIWRWSEMQLQSDFYSLTAQIWFQRVFCVNRNGTPNDYVSNRTASEQLSTEQNGGQHKNCPCTDTEINCLLALWGEFCLQPLSISHASSLESSVTSQCS